MKVKCGNCKKFIQKEDAVKSGISYFCNSDCRSNKALSQFQKAKTRKVDLDSAREEVFARDGFRCRYCGGKKNLVVHHVIYRSEIKNRQWQEEISNKISLCNEPCHLTIIHGNKKKYQPLCLKIIWLREIYGDKITLIKDIEND